VVLVCFERTQWADELNVPNINCAWNFGLINSKQQWKKVHTSKVVLCGRQVAHMKDSSLATFLGHEAHWIVDSSGSWMGSVSLSVRAMSTLSIFATISARWIIGSMQW
jgi:hypothetical protein